MEPSSAISFSSTARPVVRSEISKFFPKPETDDLLSAANLIRKRYRELEFPVPPKVAAAAEQKHPDVSVAMDMLNQMLMMPANEIHEFHEKYTGQHSLQYIYGIYGHSEYQWNLKVDSLLSLIYSLVRQWISLDL